MEIAATAEMECISSSYFVSSKPMRDQLWSCVAVVAGDVLRQGNTTPSIVMMRDSRYRSFTAPNTRCYISPHGGSQPESQAPEILSLVFSGAKSNDLISYVYFISQMTTSVLHPRAWGIPTMTAGASDPRLHAPLRKICRSSKQDPRGPRTATAPGPHRSL